MENYVNRQLSDKSMKFCIVVVHDLTNDISYNAKLNRYKMCYFGVKFKTRAPRGTDRSPEYKDHFCYKLDSRVKNETTEWNQKQQHFITHALDHCYEFGLLL